ncbi:hypothetical protein FGG08_001962 [Glutinoglossum americanum]|uniref:NADH:ubiquinone oxidoreductase intermediate-associated protein 30 domain-containing protein n=1 Tax=Glutinoglossum americanum TaxID=1670608 RepID=A0A9P8L279_9PEZI|nr:hypothetical protein FGG08_001962 [Glutinoglossum americanum]
MRASPQLLSKGFIGRSLDEFKRYANIALKQEGIRTPSAPFPLIYFHDHSSLSACKVMSDADIGGFSKASLDYIQPGSAGNPNGCTRFHGSISTQLPPNDPQVQRTGYAAWRTLDRRPTIFGRSVWDIDPYTYLAMRIKSDGRKYFVNLQTDSIVPTDIHQHRLFARRPGEWETVLIKWNEFVRTNHGQVVEPQTEILRQNVKTVGVGLIDRVPGPFELFIERIWATNGLTDHDAREDGRIGGWDSKEAETDDKRS